jgi:hypothetical protein
VQKKEAEKKFEQEFCVFIKIKKSKTLETLNSVKMKRFFDYLVILIMAAILIFTSYFAFNIPQLIAIYRRW